MHRLRIIVDAALDPGAVAAQAVHAAFAFQLEHPDAAARWMATSNTVAVLAAEVTQLAVLRDRSVARGIRCSSFHEPDRGGALTAIALEPGAAARKLCSGLRLAGAPGEDRTRVVSV